jgi:HEAT repeat protein
LNLSTSKVIPMMKKLVLAATLCSGLLIALYALDSNRSGLLRSVVSAAPQQQNAGDIPDEVREKIKLLESSNPVERAQAACTLGLMKQRAVPAIPALIKLLSDDTPTQRVNCGEGSWRGGFNEHDKTSPGEQAAGALVFIGEPAVAPLVAVIRSDDWRTRANATWALGIIKDPRATEAVLLSVRDQDWRVREKAAWGLGLKRGNNAVVEALVLAVRDNVWQVRRQAAWALGLSGDERAVEPLVAALRDDEPDVRHQAAWALGLKGDSRSVEPLNAALRDQNWQVRSQAAWALGLKGDRSSVEPLIAALKDDESHVRQQAAWALGLKGDKRAVEPLNAALQDTAAPVRKNAAWALRLIRIKSGDIRHGDLDKMDEGADMDVDVDVDVDVNVDVKTH